MRVLRRGHSRAESGMFLLKFMAISFVLILLAATAAKIFAVTFGRRVAMGMRDRAAEQGLIEFRASAGDPFVVRAVKAQLKAQAIVDANFSFIPEAVLAEVAPPAVALEFGYWDQANAPNCPGSCYTPEASPATADPNAVNAVKAAFSLSVTSEKIFGPLLLGDGARTDSGASIAAYDPDVGVIVTGH